ncbi:hypothetical protein VNO77_41904 [Canavalia gladiata]|uniref:Uncharacterized protein n=1 Tax=Canavalia gladiata TaxID=3824 RepID=A0AAN9K2B2_CANGL
MGSPSPNPTSISLLYQARLHSHSNPFYVHYYHALTLFVNILGKGKLEGYELWGVSTGPHSPCALLQSPPPPVSHSIITLLSSLRSLLFSMRNNSQTKPKPKPFFLS